MPERLTFSPDLGDAAAMTFGVDTNDFVELDDDDGYFVRGDQGRDPVTGY